MSSSLVRRSAFTGVLALACAGTFAPSALAAAPVDSLDGDLTPLTLLGTNDFHGHFTKDFACTVASAKAEYPDASFISAGDNVGGTPFESASQQDNPSIDFLNALGLEASSVGNHEFDKGFDDLTGRVSSRASWTYLGANVYKSGTTTPALPEYKVLDVNGVKVAVVGAVTTDTPNMVAGDGVAGLTFGDPVAAVNRVAAKLKDGNAANGEADVVVAEYHEGAPEGGEATLSSMQAASPVFNNIVTKTSGDVSAIFTGHTHQLYSWDAPVPGGEGTRPIIQTDFYAKYLGVLQLGYDKASGKVTQYKVTNRPVSAPSDACTSLPAYTAAAAVVDSANARAEEIGKQVVAQSSGPITSALKADGSRDDRLAESNLSNLIAQSYVDSLNKPGRTGSVEIGLMNPGGVRADLVPDASGNLTFAQAAAVMPFNNTVATREVTGATLVKILEQQWQPEGSSRPFLKLGLSKNVTYTFDENKPAGERITSVLVDGKPLEESKSYTVASNSFLITGGDNFTALKEGGAVSDSGLIDQGLFVEWLKAASPLSPNYAKQSLSVVDQPTKLTAGKEASFTVSGFDMTSKGAPANKSVEVFVDGTSVGTFPITTSSSTTPPYPANHGTASVKFTVPADASGDALVTFKAAPTGTSGGFPVTIEGGAPTTTPTGPTTEPTDPTTGPTDPTSEPSDPSSTSEPSDPSTTDEPTASPTDGTSTSTSGGGNPSSSSTSTTGPKVETDGMRNEQAVTGLAGLGLLLVAGIGAVVARLRRTV
ncbi:bifunctional metallophosphatase/5'-nucleotidase [Dermacoccus barathri]|uniref:Bifunctional metallophosphatase/5'-nucleotidase n=1 Tax=Dermacoccus barathri TaxID=322601 RepID=A0ABN2BPQ5_9MICO